MNPRYKIDLINLKEKAAEVATELAEKATDLAYVAVERVLEAAEAFHPIEDEEPFTNDFVMPGDPHVPEGDRLFRMGDFQAKVEDALDDGLDYLRLLTPGVEIRHLDPDNEQDIADLWRELFGEVPPVPSQEEVIAHNLRNVIEEAQAYGEPVEGDDIFQIVVEAFKLGYQTSEYELTLNDEWFNEFRPF